MKAKAQMIFVLTMVLGGGQGEMLKKHDLRPKT